MTKCAERHGSKDLKRVSNFSEGRQKEAAKRYYAKPTV